MSDFRNIWDKVGGADVVRQVFREHMATSTVLTTLAAGTSRKGLEIVREMMQLKLYQRISKKMQPDLPELREQVESEYAASPVGHNDTVWTLWLQGEDQAPEIVRVCFESLRQYLPDKRVVVLDAHSMREVVDMPTHIVEKYEAGIISRTHFSDLLRLELMTSMGGTWVDSTVWLSGKPSTFVTESDLFLFQNLKPGLDGKSISISNWLITAQAPSRILLLTKGLLYRYWARYDRIDDYFIFHYLMQLAIETYPEEWSNVIPSSNSLPHVLLLRLGEPFNQAVFDGVCRQTSIHKLTYKGLDQVDLKGTYLEHIIGAESGAGQNAH